MQNTLTSLVFEGVFERFPKLKVVLIEGGFAWAPALCWRMDKHWERMREETPHVKRPPSEYVREHVWFTTQPIEEPDDPQHLAEVIDWLGWDRLMFSTDYPHWDFDDPQHAFKFKMTEAQKAMVFRDNAKALYGLAVKRQVVASAGDVAPGQCKIVTVKGREIGVFNLDGEYFALANRCPHAGGPLCEGKIVALVQSDGPGHYRLARHQEFLRCPWHGWEFDIRTGQSWCDPKSTRRAAVRGQGRVRRDAGEGPLRRRDFSGLGRRRLSGRRAMTDSAQMATRVVRRTSAAAAKAVDADICVVGAGIAGVSAALEAARLGRKVVLVDGLPALGGQAVNSIIGTFCGLFSNGDARLSVHPRHRRRHPARSRRQGALHYRRGPMTHGRHV